MRKISTVYPLDLADKMITEQGIDPESWEEMEEALKLEMQRRSFNLEVQRRVLRQVKDYLF